MPELRFLNQMACAETQSLKRVMTAVLQMLASVTGTRWYPQIKSIVVIFVSSLKANHIELAFNQR